ncbi:MAG: hypothetical protein CMB64_03545 [Euryarchaeota archaeon]|nr:hypothetical protein [Euryarchaeota archaeon]
MQNFLKNFDGSRDEKFAKIVRYFDTNLDELLQEETTLHNVSILMDLGNVPNVKKLQKISSRYNVEAFADEMYNGPGVNPKLCETLKIHRISKGCKNAADTHIIWRVFQLCQNGDQTIHIVTRDKGFMQLSEIAKMYNSVVYFHFSVEELLSIFK